jgi:hypothetical protein
MEESEQRPMPVFRLAFSWSIVGIPLIWGVAQTLEKAMLLFQL